MAPYAGTPLPFRLPQLREPEYSPVTTNTDFLQRLNDATSAFLRGATHHQATHAPIPVTPTTGLDVSRLEREGSLVERLFGSRVRRCRIQGRDPESWEAYGIEIVVGSFTARGTYDHEHPYRPPRFQVTPAPRSRHYYDDGKGLHLCFLRPEEWWPSYTMATAAGIVVRFLSEYTAGRTD